jgi:DnaK suppressor protein
MNKETEVIFDRLIAMRDEVLTLSAAASDNRKPVALDQQSVGRLSRMDSLQVHAMDMAQETARRKAVIRIDAALTRLSAGDYGYCAKCDEEISKKRLELDPAVPLCIRCAV